MVDFNNDTTITRPRQDIMTFMILQKWQDTIESIQKYNSDISKGREPTLTQISSNGIALLILIRSSITAGITKSKTKTPNFTYNNITELERDLTSELDQEVFKAINFIEEFLYQKGVTKWDNRDKVDRTDIFESNKKALG